MALRRGLGKRILQALALGIMVSLASLFTYIAQPDVMQQLDRRIFDTFLKNIDPGQPHPGVVIVDIDESSLRAFGQWPWPRALFAKLIRQLQDYHAASVGLDIMLSEPDRTSPSQIKLFLKEYFGLEVGFSNLPEAMMDNDRLLAGVMSQGRVVLGSYMRFDDLGDSADLPEALRVVELKAAGAPDPKELLFAGQSMTLPLPVFRNAAPTALINISPDRDGALRSVPLVIKIQGRLYAHLSLRNLMSALGVKNLALYSEAIGLSAIKLGPYQIPVNNQGEMIVAYRGPSKTFSTYSAADLLQQKLKPEFFANKIVFVGSSAPGLRDLRTTPFDHYYPGVEVSATIVDNILSGRLLSRPSITPAIQMLAIVVLGILCAVIFALARPFVYLPWTALLIGAAMWGSWHLFTQGIFISPLYVVTNIVGCGLMIICLRFWQEDAHKKKLQLAFGRYVAPEIVSQITEKPEDLLAGEERAVSIVFTDLRGFTSVSEKLAPQQVVNMLNQYFTPMTSLVRANQGTLDKFIGDALMAFWNAPHPVERHPYLALKTVISMHQAMDSLNNDIEKDYGLRLSMGAGVHSGSVFVGNMGSKELLDYTIIGDNVNLASRLQGLSSKFGIDIVVSKPICEACGEEFAFLPLDNVRVKGKKEPVEVLAAFTWEQYQQHQAEFTTFKDAYQLYTQARFIAAEQIFSALANEFPDSKLYAVYQDRCAWLIKEPPAEWDGIWSLTDK
jgi:adenylate cyclase